MRRSLELVVPLHNAQQQLEQRITRLHRHTRTALPQLDVRITIADAASTDLSGVVAMALADRLPGVRLRKLDRPGHGDALRTLWQASDADFVAYTDADLAIEPTALGPLLRPLLRGEAELAIGSRLVPGAEVERPLRHELGSRIYNLLLWRLLDVRVADAHCGLKAARRKALLPLLERVESHGRFFDAELLWLAQRDGLRIAELPVRWRQDRDARVPTAATAAEQLREIWRLRSVGRSQRRPAPHPARREPVKRSPATAGE